MTARRQALRRRLEEAEFAAHELWIERFYGELRRVLEGYSMDTQQLVIVSLRAFVDGLHGWPPTTKYADIEAGTLSNVEGVDPGIGAELRRRMTRTPY